VVVAGSDLSLEGARYETRRLAGEWDAMVLRRGKWFVTVVPFDRESAARTAVAPIAEATGRQPFVREFARWCPTPRTAEEGVLVCDV
jgi:hypothetical protein